MIFAYQLHITYFIAAIPQHAAVACLATLRALARVAKETRNAILTRANILWQQFAEFK